MGRKSAERRGRKVEGPACGGPVKMTFRLSDSTAKRLGVESVMTGRSMSEIVEGVLSGHLARWRLPSNVADPAQPAPERADGAEGAA